MISDNNRPDLDLDTIYEETNCTSINISDISNHLDSKFSLHSIHILEQSAEWWVKPYVMGRMNFLFRYTSNGTHLMVLRMVQSTIALSNQQRPTISIWLNIAYSVALYAGIQTRVRKYRRNAPLFRCHQGTLFFRQEGWIQ